MKIFFDLDGVVIDFETAFLSFVNGISDKKISKINLQKYNLAERYNISKESLEYFMRLFYKNYNEGEVFKESKEVIYYLNTLGFEIGFITSAPQGIIHKRIKKLTQEFPFVKIENINYSKTKFDVINEKNIDYFIDDNNLIIKNIEENSKCKAIFKDNGYKAIEYNPYFKIYNIKEIINFI